MRIRNALAFATHSFFQREGFMYCHTPLITGADCEGAGEMFQVTTMDLSKPLPRAKDGSVDKSKDFFGKPSYLTVSGQLHAEHFACAFGSVYTFGPTFRAEDSYTTRHLAEFWMIEPEIAFTDLEGDMDCAEGYLRHCFRYVLDNCDEDLSFLEKMYTKDLKERLRVVADEPFARITYVGEVYILIQRG
jgi:asparaginyl-tRNA synthetase